MHSMDCALRLVVVALLVAGLEPAPAAAQTVPTPVAIQPAPLTPTQPPSTDQFFLRMEIGTSSMQANISSAASRAD